MARIYIGGAGGAPSNNFIRSIREGCPDDHLIGASSVPSDLFLSDTHERHVVPPALHPSYDEKILELLGRTKPDFMHVQHDFEVRKLSQIRDRVHALGVKTFLPSHQTIDDCVDKGRSYAIWATKGVPVPKTLPISSEADLREAFRAVGPKIWLRAVEGGGGTGALPTDNFGFAKAWIDAYKGWGSFTAAECLTPETVTWLSIWAQGELVVAQTRRRRRWNFGNRTLSGVTGITGVAETFASPLVDETALAAIMAIDARPHGIYGVDMTYDGNGVPRATEINIGRFFTTHYFFTKAGLNMPKIVRDIVVEGTLPLLTKKVNPLPNGLVWIRGMDSHPVMVRVEELERMENSLG
jgi:hypothetical protein